MLAGMNLIGDLERLFATSLYPLRAPIAIVVVLALIAIAVVASRRGWYAAARRHPRRSGSVLGLALAIGLPLAWYLASPLVIRTDLIEPPPVAVAESAPTATPGSDGNASGSDAPGPSTPTTDPSPASSAFVPTIHTAGSFNGADEFHFGEGSASIIETEPGVFTLRLDDFSVRNGPDLYVYLSPDPDGYADGALELGPLKATDGAFGYELPTGTEPEDFESAVIWCKQFAVLFAVAPLEAA